MPLSEENKLIELKYAAKTFGKMDDNERQLSAYQILLKIHAITGWTIPASELMDILVGQFEKKLSENYANVNEQEVEYAFRNRGIEVKDWGKAMNLGLIDEVMIPYLANRFELSRAEETLNKSAMIEEKKEITDDEMMVWIDEWSAKTEINIELIPLMFYDFLIEKGILKISSQEKWEALDKAKTAIKVHFHNDISTCKTNNALIAFTEFEQMENTGFTGSLKDRILNHSKRIIVYGYLKKP